MEPAIDGWRVLSCLISVGVPRRMKQHEVIRLEVFEAYPRSQRRMPHKQQGPRRSEGLVTSKKKYLLGATNNREDHSEREQSERFDEGETKDEEQEDARTCTRVASKSFSRRSRRLTLTESAKTRSECHAQTSSQRNPLVCRSGGSLCKRRRSNHHHRQSCKRVLHDAQCINHTYSMPP